MKSVLDKRRTSLEITSTDLNEQLNASFRTFDRLLAKIRGLFDMSSCDMWPLEQLLGKSNSDLEKISNYLISNLVIWLYFVLEHLTNLATLFLTSRAPTGGTLERIAVELWL